MAKLFDKIKQYFDNKVLEYERKSFEDELKGVCMSVRDPHDVDDYFDEVFNDELPHDIGRKYFTAIDDVMNYICDSVNKYNRINVNINKIEMSIDGENKKMFECEVAGYTTAGRR